MRFSQRDKKQVGIVAVEINGRTIQVPLFSNDIVKEVQSIPAIGRIHGIFLAQTISQQINYLTLIYQNFKKKGVLRREDMDQLRSGFMRWGFTTTNSNLCYYK